MRLCKTFFAVIGLMGSTLAAQAQIADAPVQPGVASAAFGAPAEKIKIDGVPNAGRINETLLRGAQPSARGLAELKKLGITTIVDLRGNSGPVAWERAQAESLGMHFVDIPVDGWSAPRDQQVAEFLKLVKQEPAQKIFVHCYYGRDRTGVMIAAYRMAQQNWTPEQAAAEMDSFGFHYHWFPAMKSYVRQFPLRLASDPVLASFRLPTHN